MMPRIYFQPTTDNPGLMECYENVSFVSFEIKQRCEVVGYKTFTIQKWYTDNENGAVNDDVIQMRHMQIN